MIQTYSRYLFLLIPILFLFSCQNNQETIPSEDRVWEVSNFALHDQNGDFHNLYYHSDASAVVLFIHGNACPIVRNAIPDLKAIRAKYEDKDVRFFMLNSNLQDNRTSIAHEAEEFEMDFPILVDEAQLVGEALQLKRTAEVLLLDPKSWEIMYRGPLSDRIGYESQRNEARNDYLANAIDSLLSGGTIEKPYLKGMGCLIKFANADKTAHANLTYEKDIAPILVEKCMQCHVEGGIATWAMKDYETVFGWSNMMREVIRTKRMPPWQADAHYGKYKNDISLSQEEIQTLVHWIEAGAKREGGEDPLKKYEAKIATWELGEPDILIELEPEEIPATGVIEYRYQEFELDFEKDVWANAIQVIPGNTAVMHHMLVSVIYPDGFVEPMDRKSPWLDGLFASWAPGLEVEKFPAGSGRILPKGSKLWFQLHYTTSGKEETDASKIGIYITEEKPEKEYLIVGPYNPEIVIPPHAKAYKNKAKEVFDRDIVLYGMGPHMHFRGKSMKYTAIYPDQSKEILLNVPNYNFNWQRYYLLEEPKSLPAGTTILVEAAFDNSAQNTFNPHPEKTVYWGDFTIDEMLIGYMSFMYDDGEEELSME